MATWNDVERLAGAMPGVEEGDTRGSRAWKVGGKAFVMDRPLRRGDYEALGDSAPDGPILGAWLPGLDAKAALLAEQAGPYFTTPHFDGYAMILAELDDISLDELEELIVEAWLARAPKRLAREYLDQSQL